MVCSTFVSFQDSMSFTFQLPGAPSESTVASPGSPYSALDMELKDQSGFQDLYQEPLQALSPPLQAPRATVTSPTRCLSRILAFPIRENGSGSDRSRGVSNAECGDSSGLFSHSLLQGVKPDDAQHKVSFISPARLQFALQSESLLAVKIVTKDANIYPPAAGTKHCLFFPVAPRRPQ